MMKAKEYKALLLKYIQEMSYGIKVDMRKISKYRRASLPIPKLLDREYIMGLGQLGGYIRALKAYDPDKSKWCNNYTKKVEKMMINRQLHDVWD